jgi:HEAT repeat protein
MWSWLLNLFGLGKPTPARMARRLQSPRPEVRLEAVKTLATIPQPWAMELLLPLLDHADSALSAAARADLLSRGAALVPVVGGRIDRSDPATAKRLLELLADLKIPEAAQALLQTLKYSARPSQLAAKQALIRCGAVALPALEEASDEPNPWVHRQIEDVLTALTSGTA